MDFPRKGKYEISLVNLEAWELEKRVQGESAKMSRLIQGNYQKSSRIAPADTPCSSE